MPEGLSSNDAYTGNATLTVHWPALRFMMINPYSLGFSREDTIAMLDAVFSLSVAM